jgi:hypothetical protein
MRFVTGRNLYFGFILLFAFPAVAFAIPTIACHCFTDRSFDPARPALADPYFLATTQNSLFAHAFNIDKKTIVMKKQQGTSSDDLWIAYWVALKSGRAAENLLQEKEDKEAWSEIVVPLRLSTQALGDGFSRAMMLKTSTAHLADAVVDELFLRNQLLNAGELVAIRQAGASNQELIIAAVVAAKTRQPARQVYLEVKNGSKTWGSLLLGARIDAKNMQQEIAALFPLPPR